MLSREPDGNRGMLWKTIFVAQGFLTFFVPFSPFPISNDPVSPSQNRTVLFSLGHFTVYMSSTM